MIYEFSARAAQTIHEERRETIWRTGKIMRLESEEVGVTEAVEHISTPAAMSY